MTDIVNNTDLESSAPVFIIVEDGHLDNTTHEAKPPTEAETVGSEVSEADEPPSLEDSPLPTGAKRARKTVQRLSETWNKAFATKEEERAKQAKFANADLEAGKGLTLGSIEAIESNIKKTKPVDLKPLHQMIYGRPGTMMEIRSNLRKFHGFGFTEDSQQYEKKIHAIQQRSTSELRDSLRILQLEVSGTREAMVSRLTEFLLKPTLNVLKHSGNLPKKVKRRKSKGSAKSGSGRKSQTKTSISSGGSAGALSSSVSIPDDESGLSSEGDTKPTRAPTPKRKAPQPSRTGPSKKSKKKPRDCDDSLSENGTSVSPKRSNSSTDEDIPLAALKAPKPPVKPSDEDLKLSIVGLLKTVNLEETSLKVVRQRIFDRYPGVDLSDKKEFINTTVKEYLSNS